MVLLYFYLKAKQVTFGMRTHKLLRCQHFYNFGHNNYVLYCILSFTWMILRFVCTRCKLTFPQLNKQRPHLSLPQKAQRIFRMSICHQTLVNVNLSSRPDPEKNLRGGAKFPGGVHFFNS